MRPWQIAERQHIVEVLTARRTRDEEWVLDAGCGHGECAASLAQANFFVIGVDRSAAQLSKARAQAVGDLARRLHFVAASLDEPLDFGDAHFDHVICLNALAAVENPVFTLSELHRVLNVGGTLILAHSGKAVSPPGHTVMPAQEGIAINDTVWERLAQGAARGLAAKPRPEHEWSTVDLHDMLRLLGFRIIEVDDAPQLLFVAEKE